MEQSDIISSLKTISKHVKSLIKALESPKKKKEVCTCHERDSSFVCSLCYSQGMRGHMQEGGESKWCDYCGLYTDGPVCKFCGGNTETKEVI